jgi:AcrR family transcriptional regulator
LKNPSPPAAEKVGRPRLFDDATEKNMIMDAAVAVMTQNGYAKMTVADVLSAANLSTSSYYRHFSSKDALAEALIRRDGHSVRRTLDEVIGANPDPVTALDAWLEATLNLFYDPVRARRTALLSNAEIMSSRRMAAVTAEMQWLLAEPLAEVLRIGHQTGVLFSPTPEADAVSMFALVSGCAMSSHSFPASRSAAKAHVTRFAWPAFRVLDHSERPRRVRPRSRPTSDSQNAS